MARMHNAISAGKAAKDDKARRLQEIRAQKDRGSVLLEASQQGVKFLANITAELEKQRYGYLRSWFTLLYAWNISNFNGLHVHQRYNCMLQFTYTIVDLLIKYRMSKASREWLQCPKVCAPGMARMGRKSRRWQRRRKAYNCYLLALWTWRINPNVPRICNAGIGRVRRGRILYIVVWCIWFWMTLLP